MTNKRLNTQQLKAICDVLGDTTRGYTKTELSRLLQQSGISLVDDGSRSYNDGQYYSFGLNKRDWLCNCLSTELNNYSSSNKVYIFIENCLNPVAFTDESKRDQYRYLFEDTNKALIMAGLMISSEGFLQEVTQAKTLDEVDRRVNGLKKQLYDRKIHCEVQKYCITDYLRKDYYDAVFEAAKGLAERVRQITGLSTDGATLFQTALSTKDPYLFFNSLKAESEINEFIGLKELLESIFHLVRNPAAHTPKINWKIDENKAMDILTLISFAHKYLDECHKMPNK